MLNLYIAPCNENDKTEYNNLVSKAEYYSKKYGFYLCKEAIDFNNSEGPKSKEKSLYLVMDVNGLSLTDGTLTMNGDFSDMIKRLVPNNLNGEMLVKASRFKNKEGSLYAIDATAGMGEDSFLLAAAGYNVKLFEYNPVVAALLEDAIARANENDILHEIANRMQVVWSDSVEYMNNSDEACDLILLDPMFPKRNKSGLIKKKFQLIQQLESPCSNEEDLLQAAIHMHPDRIVIKRPAKGPYLAGIKPSYSIQGNAIRYDCIVK